MIRVHVFVSGRVQGVGYRYATAEMADQLGLKGWVRNRSDGRVEAVFEGDRAQVDAILNWCHQGPPAAIVQAVDVTDEAPEGLQTFDVRR